MKGLTKIKDERLPKRPQSGYLVFATERRVSGDYKNIEFVEAAKLITKEWKALGPAETKVSNFIRPIGFSHANHELSRNTRISRQRTKPVTYASINPFMATQPPAHLKQQQHDFLPVLMANVRALLDSFRYIYPLAECH